MGKRDSPKIFIVSDGRGVTCRQVVRAALVQFEGHHPEFSKHTAVITVEQVAKVVKKAAKAGGTIFYTLVSEETRKAMEEFSAAELVPSVDLLGPTFIALNDLFKAERGASPGLLYESDRETYDRIDAIDFTLTHDDGQHPHSLKFADVVLVGVSRAAKSSTCFYLAYSGIRAANVPLFRTISPPAELLEMDPNKVIGLTLTPQRLKALREARVARMEAGPLDDYVDEREITYEIRSAHEQMAKYGWRRINVSYMAIEEVAKEVTRLRGIKRRTVRG